MGKGIEIVKRMAVDSVLKAKINNNDSDTYTQIYTETKVRKASYE